MAGRSYRILVSPVVVLLISTALTSAESSNAHTSPGGASSAAALSSAAATPVKATVLPGSSAPADDEGAEVGTSSQGQEKASPQTAPGSEPGTASSRTVTTKYGTLRGVVVTLDNRHLEPVEVYRGIPYAMPPVENYRFMPPVSGAQWPGIRLAEHFAPVCPQRLPDISNETAALQRMPRGRLDALKRLLPHLQRQSEDCLYLNLYAPATQVASRKAPVLVFIHGESYEWNSGNPYDASVLTSYGGVVVVTVNYRLGILGFLNANNDPHVLAPANYGLMDIIAALHWLQENVASFGGDPGSVTLVGHGTGAACVQLLMMSPAVPEGLLFHRAILMSGSALSPGALVGDPRSYALRVARHVNCSVDVPLPHLMACLRKCPLSAIMSTPIEAPEFTWAFGPTVDGVVVPSSDPPPGSTQSSTGSGSMDPSKMFGLKPSSTGSGVNVPQSSSSQSSSSSAATSTAVSASFPSMNELLQRKSVSAKLAKYSLLLGVVRAEAFLAFSSSDEQFGLEAERRARLLRAFVRNTLRFHRAEILATVLNEYTDWERPVQHPVNLRDETLEALSDARVVAPTVLTADLHAAVSANRSFLYVFDYQTKYGDYQQRQGCIHGEDVPYILGAPLAGPGGLSFFTKNFTKSETILSEIVMTYWTNFARTGIPSDPVDESARRADRSRYRTIEWPPYEAVHKKYLHLDVKPRVKTHYRAHRLSFWLHLVPELHRPGGDAVPAAHHQLPDDPSDPSSTSRSGGSSGHPPTSVSAKTASPAPTTPRSSVPTATVDGGSHGDPGSGVHGSGVPGVDSPNPIPTPATTEDGFAAYSTALSATVAIGCTLLLLNMLVFACVFKQRDKHRESGSGGGGSGGGGNTDVGTGGSGTLKKRAENGQIHSGVCATDHLQMLPGGMATVTASTVPHHFHGHTPHGHTPHRLAHLPPPDVAELPRGYATLPHPTPSAPSPAVGVLPASSTSVADATGTLPRPPPPPKAPKAPQVPQPQVPVVPTSGVPLQHLDSGGTLKKRVGGADMLPGHHSQHSRMEEFRV